MIKIEIIDNRNVPIVGGIMQFRIGQIFPYPEEMANKLIDMGVAKVYKEKSVTNNDYKNKSIVPNENKSIEVVNESDIVGDIEEVNDDNIPKDADVADEIEIVPEKKKRGRPKRR